MDKLMEQYFARLSNEVKGFEETKVVYELLKNNQPIDRLNFNNSFAQMVKAQKKVNFPSSTVAMKDFRIRKYYIGHFRKFHEYNCKPFVLDLTTNGTFSSLFLVGKNSSGKTSLFSGLEYLYKGENISSAKWRNVTDLNEFLPYGNERMNDVKLSLIINDKDTDGKTYKEISKPLTDLCNLSAFFCCESDLSEIQKEDNLTRMFYQNLGLDGIIKVKRQLENLITLDKTESLSDVTFPITYSYDTLQDDLLLIFSYNDKGIRDYCNQLVLFDKSLRMIIPSDSNATFKDDIGLMNVVLECIFKNRGILENLSYFKANQVRLSNYKKIVDSSSKNPVEAFSLYKAMVSIQVFLKELKDYFEQLYAVFSSAELSKTILRAKVVRKINDVVANNTLQHQLYLIQQNHSADSVSKECREHLSQLIDEFSLMFNEDRDNIIKAYEKTVIPILNEFTRLAGYEYERVVLDADDGRLSIKINNNYVSQGFMTTPKRFYNSFRLKLYAVSVRVTLAFLVMKMYSIKVPLVFDDIFTASDFDNSVNIDRFFHFIFDSFQKMELGDKRDLQIIMFSHDEVILNMIPSLAESFDVREDVNFIRGILLDPKEIDENSDAEKIGDKTIAYSLIEKLM